MKSELFEDDDIKTRSLAFENYQSGSVKKEFVHVTAKILSGRNIAQKKKLTESIMSQLEKIDFQSTLLTIEIVEMEKETYSRVRKVR